MDYSIEIWEQNENKITINFKYSIFYFEVANVTLQIVRLNNGV